MERNEYCDLLTACKLAYRKFHLEDELLGHDEVVDFLQNAICNKIGDDGFQAWLKRQEEAKARCSGPF